MERIGGNYLEDFNMRTLWKYIREEGIFGWNWRHVLLHPWIIFGESYRQIKWFIQRGKRGYSDRDVWNLYDYLAGWIPQAIKQLRENGMGTPVGLTEIEWKQILIEIEEGFKAVVKISELDFDVEPYQYWKDIADKGLQRLHEHFQDLWD